MITKNWRFFLLSALLSSSAFGQEKFIDLIHRKISSAVYTTVSKLDSFFADPRIKEESKAYLRFRAGFRYDTSPDFTDILKADFKIRLVKLEKRLGIFVESYKERLTREEEEEPLEVKEENKEQISLGVEYRPEKPKILRHRFSIGITSSPKIYAKYFISNIPVIYKRWEITAYQWFRVEKRIKDYKLEERTQLYVDRLIAPNHVWRIYLERYKDSKTPYQVVNYISSLRIFNPTGFYKKPLATEVLAGITQNRLINARVSNYTVQYRIRANFYKKWAFFNVYTGSDWPEDRGFKITPFIKIFFEFYFGRI